MLVTPPAPSKADALPLKARIASNTLRRKSKLSPLEDALSAEQGKRAVQIVQFAREQWANYKASLSAWRENRRKWEQEAADVFKHRELPEFDEEGKPRVFVLKNDSLNVIGALAEFASAQAEQDLFGGEPWFAAVPVGPSDPALADVMQKHLQWLHRDGRLVTTYAQAVTRTTCLGEAFTLTTYEIEMDSFEAEVDALHLNGKPLLVDGALVRTVDEAEAYVAAGKLKIPAKATLEWGVAYEKRDEIRSQGTVTSVLQYTNVAFREDAPELLLKHTNFYHEVEMPVLEAMRRYKLSKADALKLAGIAEVRTTVKDEHEETPAKPDSQHDALDEVQYIGTDEERLLNSRVRLIVGYLRIDPFGTGKSSDICIVMTPDDGDDRLWYANYLANLSPDGKLPVECHRWEAVPDRLYGRGFFAKYAHVQKQVDDLWNQIAYRNAMHANPVTGYDPKQLQNEEDETDAKLAPGMTKNLKANAKISDVYQFLAMPDLDDRSMELMNIGIQMVQLRSGITSASQGDMAAVPENNTATGIRQLMSRAAVLLKKPIRGLRRSFSRDFAFNTKLTYANFNRDEAFQWGEGENTELLTLEGDKVKNLDIDVRMLLTQEQNQTKLESAQVAMSAMQQYLAALEPDKASLRPLVLQIIKALEFDQADEIVRQPMLNLESVMQILPPEEQNRVQMLLQSEQMAQTLPAPVNSTPPAIP